MVDGVVGADTAVREKLEVRITQARTTEAWSNKKPDAEATTPVSEEVRIMKQYNSKAIGKEATAQEELSVQFGEDAEAKAEDEQNQKKLQAQFKANPPSRP